MRTLFYIFMLSANFIVHADSMLRVNCVDEDVDARIELRLEGSEEFVFKGTCPLDLKVPAGKHLLRLKKFMDETEGPYRWNNRSVEIGDGAVQKIDMPRLSNYGATKESLEKFNQENPEAVEEQIRIDEEAREQVERNNRELLEKLNRGAD